MNMLIKSLILFAFVAYAAAEYATTYDLIWCIAGPNVTTHTKDVLMQVSECHASHTHCPLYQGKTHSVIFKFKTLKTYTGKVDFRVYGVFEKFTVPYRGKSDAYQNAAYTDNGDSVQEMGTMIEDREIKHTSDFTVSANYPQISLRVRFVIIERKTKEMIMCRELPVQIMAAPGAQTEN